MEATFVSIPETEFDQMREERIQMKKKSQQDEQEKDKLTEKNNKLNWELFERAKEYREMEKKLLECFQEKGLTEREKEYKEMERKLQQSYHEKDQLNNEIERLKDRVKQLRLQTPQEHEDQSVTPQEEEQITTAFTCPHSCGRDSFIYDCRQEQIPICPFNLIMNAAFSAGYSAPHSVHTPPERLECKNITALLVNSKILNPVESIHDFPDPRPQMLPNVAMTEAIANVATKEAIANVATKEAIANVATKEATANVATKEAIANVATKEAIARVAMKMESNVGLLGIEYHNRDTGHLVCFKKLENQRLLIWDAEKKVFWSDNDYSHIKAVHCYEVNTEHVKSLSATCSCLATVIQPMEICGEVLQDATYTC